MNPEDALAMVEGEYGRGGHHFGKNSDYYRLTVYGVGEPVLFNGRWEFRHFVCRLEWLTGHAGPGKDRAVLQRELSELGYFVVKGPDPLDEHTSECVVRPHFRRQA